MNKLRNKKNRKHLITLVCLLVGMLVLTTAVYANSDDAKGYSNFKEAVKQLAFYEENFSLDGELNFAMDGKPFTSAKVSYVQDGENSATIQKSADAGFSEYAYESYIVNGKTYHYYPVENTYYSNEFDGSGMPDMDDPMVKKTVSFVELLGDTLVGDLKNNVVYVGGEGGSKDYTVNISGTQVPEVVNAGLSLMIGAQNNSTQTRRDNFVTFEDYMVAFTAYYEKETGETFNQEAYLDGSMDVSEIEAGMQKYYDDILKSNGDVGVLFVKMDGGYEYYGTYEEYEKKTGSSQLNTDDIFSMMGDDPYIDSVLCDFSIDEDGNLSAVKMKAAMAGKDESGKKHTVSMEIKGTAKDFGSSKVLLPDFSKVTDTSGKSTGASSSKIG